MDARIELADAISTLREQLTSAMQRGTGQQLQFSVGPVELEFHTEIGREGGGSGKVRFWVIEAGADAKVSATSTQVLKIRLEPVDVVTGKPVLVAEGATSPDAGTQRRQSTAVG